MSIKQKSNWKTLREAYTKAARTQNKGLCMIAYRKLLHFENNVLLTGGA